MKLEHDLVKKLSNLSLLGYYNKELKMLCVHFFGDDSKNDLIAYMLPDLSWDLREITGEDVTLCDDHECIRVRHASVGKFGPDSAFDKLVRDLLGRLLLTDGFADPDVSNILRNGYTAC